MPSHPDRVRMNYSDVPLEIQKRYHAGERRIVVDKETYWRYLGTVKTIARLTDGPEGKPEQFVCYKDAKVVMQ